MNKTAFALLVSSLFVGTSQAELVTNGGFETGDFTGWTLNQSNADATNGNVGVTDFPSFVASGNYGVYLTPSSVATLSQTIATVAGHAYVIQYDLTSYAGNPGNQSNFSASFGGVLLTGGPSLPVNDPNLTVIPTWAHYSFNVVANSASTVLQFTASNQTGYFAIDNVSAVPEADEYVLMLLGAGLVAFQVRRKKATLEMSTYG